MPRIPGHQDPNPPIIVPKGILTRMTEKVLGTKFADRYEKLNTKTGKMESIPTPPLLPSGQIAPPLPPLPPFEKIQMAPPLIQKPTEPMDVIPQQFIKAPPILSTPMIPVFNAPTRPPIGSGISYNPKMATPLETSYTQGLSRPRIVDSFPGTKTQTQTNIDQAGSTPYPKYFTTPIPSRPMVIPSPPVDIIPAPPILSTPMIPVFNAPTPPKPIPISSPSINTNAAYGAGAQALVNKTYAVATPIITSNNLINQSSGYNAGAQALVNKAYAVASPSIAQNAALNQGSSYGPATNAALNNMPKTAVQGMSIPTPSPMIQAAAVSVGVKAAGLKGFGDWGLNNWLPWLVVGGVIVWLCRKR